jgi:dUTP pyrophosphatase
MFEEITIKFKRLSEEFNNIPLPSYSTSGSAGMDIRAAIKEPVKLKPIGILNSPGTIDSDYRGELKIILINFSNEEFIIQPGDRIAQIILSKVYKARLEETEELNTSKRGQGGFGHSGKS